VNLKKINSHFPFHISPTSPFSLFPFLTAIIFIPFCILIINSCTTEPQTGSLMGTVNLEGESDHSGKKLINVECLMLNS